MDSFREAVNRLSVIYDNDLEYYKHTDNIHDIVMICRKILYTGSIHCSNSKGQTLRQMRHIKGYPVYTQNALEKVFFEYDKLD